MHFNGAMIEKFYSSFKELDGDGKIIQHHDDFNFWKWSVMALGPIGLTLGWSPLVKNKVQMQAAKNLETFIRKSEG